MRLHQREVAPLVQANSLLHIALAKKISGEKYESFFIQDKYSHLMICWRVMEPRRRQLKENFTANPSIQFLKSEIGSKSGNHLKAASGVVSLIFIAGF